MTDKDGIIEGIGDIKRQFTELEKYVEEGLNRMTSKLEEFSTSFTNLKALVYNSCRDIQQLDMNRSTLESTIYESFDYSKASTPNTSTISSRLPKYVSPSIRCKTTTTICPIPPIELPKEKLLGTLRNVIKGFLIRKLYNSERVLAWRDTVKESKKIIDELSDENKNDETERELKQRLKSEIEMIKQTIYEVFFLYVPVQQIRIIRHSKSFLNSSSISNKSTPSSKRINGLNRVDSSPSKLLRTSSNITLRKK